MMGPPRKMPSRLSASRILSSDKAERSSSAPPSFAQPDPGLAQRMAETVRLTSRPSHSPVSDLGNGNQTRSGRF
ncbi:unnamed protein product [Caenorhabditis auriculariae]|uniref:Uncharacterized protein n=1 Tax=Caenorhabditis auriculariae TaxID=2777116 RepID=A0A8S1GSI1_9PELO|nr:unnamed protein product [Caenorhabditis auriculariae]